MAQNGVVAIGGGVSNGPSPSALFAKKAEVVYKFLPTNFLASLNIYHSNIKNEADAAKAELFMNYSLHDLNSPSLYIALGLDGRVFKYVDLTAEGSFTSLYSLKYKLPSVKVYAFEKKDIQYNTSVPIALIVDKKATLPEDVLLRVLGCSNTTNISKTDLEVLNQSTTVCIIFSYVIYKK